MIGTTWHNQHTTRSETRKIADKRSGEIMAQFSGDATMDRIGDDLASHDTQSAVTLAMSDKTRFVSFLNEHAIEQQYRILTSVGECILHVEHIKNEMSDFLEATAKKQGCEYLMYNDKHTWDRLKDYARKARDDRDRKSLSMAKVKAMWPTADIDKDFEELIQRNIGSTTWRALQALSHTAIQNDTSYQQMKFCILQGQWSRLGNRTGKRGTRLNVGIEAQDINTARRLITEGFKGDVHAIERCLVRAGYGVSAKGFITQAGSQVDVGVLACYSDSLLEKSSQRRRQVNLQQCRVVELLQTDHHQVEQPITDTVTTRDPSPEIQLAELDTGVGDGGGGQRTDLLEDFDESDSSVSVEHKETNQLRNDLKKRKRDNDDVGGPDNTRMLQDCGCGLKVPENYMKAVGSGTVLDQITQSLLIKRWKRLKDSRLCYFHTRMTSSALGMRGQGLSFTNLKKRLEAYYSAVVNSSIGDLKTSNDSYDWFRKTERPTRASDSLGPYKYLHLSQPHDLQLTVQNQVELCEYLSINRERWVRDGSVNVDCFGWWKDLQFPVGVVGYDHLAGRTIYDVANEEFDMYLYHLRQINGRPNWGWSRTMFHSLTQQAVRQDPVYFMMYAALREDRNVNLVSYPYYTKHQRKGDTTAFRHIDINVPAFTATGRGRYLIQGSVSLDDEDDEDCTEILPGMHHHLKEWATSWMAERSTLSAAVHAIGPDDFTPQDAEKYKTKWTPVPCKALQVRITQPHLPHGAKGPAKRTRRTILPWFIGLQKDLHTLEVTEAGTFDQLSTAHRDLTSGPRSPSGHPNTYGDIPFAFPAAVRLTGMGAVSDSLVAQLKHDNLLVVSEKRLLLHGTPAQRDQYVADWRRAAVSKIVVLFEQVKEFEKQSFAEKSYWFRREQGIADAAPRYDPDPDPSGDGYEVGGHGVEVVNPAPKKRRK